MNSAPPKSNDEDSCRPCSNPSLCCVEARKSPVTLAAKRHACRSGAGPAAARAAERLVVVEESAKGSASTGSGASEETDPSPAPGGESEAISEEWTVRHGRLCWSRTASHGR